jgi:hypothetical protein
MNAEIIEKLKQKRGYNISQLKAISYPRPTGPGLQVLANGRDH